MYSNSESQFFSASGKLLLFGEFLVLKGALCLAMPLNYGQYLQVSEKENKEIIWEAFDHKNNCWFHARLDEDLKILETNQPLQAAIVIDLLKKIRKQKATFFSNGWHFKFNLDFNREYGFGTSSTMLSLLSQWSGVDVYELSAESFKTSGYDLAAARESQPFIYTIKNKIESSFTLPESITNRLLFIYSGKKQTTSGIAKKFSEQHLNPTNAVEQMNRIVSEAAVSIDIEKWEELMTESEDLLAPMLQMKPVKELYFKDYPYAIKSLGAWGGDFIMATYRDLKDAQKYFKEKGYEVQYTYNELIKP